MNAYLPDRSPITEIERAALARFAAEYGREWKQYLFAAWLSHSYKGRHMGGQDTGTLRQIRNQRGHEWVRRLRTADLDLVRTKDNTKPMDWWALANKAFAERGLPEPTFGAVHDAYQMGESPETWADYVLRSTPTDDRDYDWTAG
jgi:hypothetical protein